MQLTALAASRKINLVLTALIIIIVAGVIILFVRHRSLIKTVESPAPPEKTGANVAIKNFHHVASENGVIQWTLDAGSASLYSDENAAKLNNISVVYYTDKNRNLTLTANKGLLNSATNDMTISGTVVARTAGYRMTTERLNYIHHSRMIQITEPVAIDGPLMNLSADTMTYDMNTQTITCEGNIKGSFVEYDENMPEK